MIDQFNRSDDEIDDVAKHAMADGHSLIRAIADTLSEITYRAEPISREQLHQLHAQLGEMWLTLYKATLDRFGAELQTATYSDGSPVVAEVETIGAADDVPQELFSGDISGEPGWQLITNPSPIDRSM